MRMRVSIDDETVRELEEIARKEKLGFGQVLNRTLRGGLQGARKQTRAKGPFHQMSYDMGVPRMDLTKALALAAEMEDREIFRKLEM